MPLPAQPLPADLGPLRLDAATTVFLQRQLTQILNKTIEVPFGPLKAEQLIPMIWDINPGAERYSYDQVTARGVAEWHASGANDFPRANISREEMDVRLHSFFIGYGYTLQEIRAAMFTGQPLKDKEATACRRAIDAFRNRVHISGDTTVGYEGFINNSLVNVANATTGTWGSATGDQIAQAILDAVLDIWEDSREVYTPDTVAVPASVWGRLTGTGRGANTDITLAEWIKKTVPQIKNIVPMTELETAGVSGTKRMVVYLKDPDVLAAHGAINFMQHPEQQKSNLDVFVPCEGRIGPVVVDIPIAMVYRDGL